MPEERTRVEAKCQGNTWECRGIQENTGECQGNVWEWVQSARGRFGECSGRPGERMGVGVNCQGNAGNAGECQGNVWEWVYSARRMQGTTRGMQGSGCKCERNEGECR